ncbi:MAG TPA: CYTH and CHAD domain-containing protein [Steroidobacteraceae bacterium]|jgi:triphosphatase|nr:CYTH and CHAD domain-containing protein [Steroidobacteraceae bacterium]
MTRSAREVELTLRLPAGGRAILEANSVLAAATPKQFHQVTTYFDTPDGVLNEAGLTLRVRRIGVNRIQTIKSLSNGRGVARTRREWEWRIGQTTPDVGRLAKVRRLARVASQIQDRLEPLFVTDIQRTARTINLDDHTVIEAVIDEGTIEAGAGCEAVSELELELKAGCVAPMYRLAAELQMTTPCWASPESKFSRGLQLRTGHTASAHSPQTIPLRRRTLAADGFHQILGGALGHLMANIAPTLRGASEAVHQMRAGLRAARAALQLFERHLDRTTVQGFDTRLQHFAQIIGTARDWDVFCVQTLPAAAAELPANALRGLKSAAEVQRQAAHAVVVKAVHGQAFTALVLRLAVWMEALAAQPSVLSNKRMGKRLRTLAPSLLNRVDRKARNRARHVDRLSARELHSLRKSLRKLRYAVDCFSGLFRRHAVKAYCARCEQPLELLGTINDAVVAQRLAEHLATNQRPDLRKSATILALWCKRRSRKARLGLKGALSSFRAAPTFWS